MERDDRSALATFFTPEAPAVGETLVLSDAAAHHARVKRLHVGDPIRLTNGFGLIATGELSSLNKSIAEIRVHRAETVEPGAPIHLRVAIGDRDRMLWLAEKATELGIASWQGVRFRRSMSVSPRGEGTAFAEKLRARMIAALEQSGAAWLPRLIADTDPDAVDVPSYSMRILLDAQGPPLLADDLLSSTAEPVVLFGPEGGVDAGERSALIDAGWRPARLAQNILRFETAGIAAVAVIRAARMRLND